MNAIRFPSLAHRLVTSRILHQHPFRHTLLSSSSRSTSTYEKITFIGTGKIAQALLSPLIETSIQPAEKITVYDVSTSAMKQISETFKGVQTSDSIPQAMEGSDLVIMAVKPQNVNNVYEEMRKSNIREDATLLSVIAGKTIENLVSGSGIRKVCRSMPNTPAIIGQGMTVWCCTTNIPSEERDKISSVLGSFGKSIYVDDENYIDMSTSISGSGPAYIFLLMEAMIDAGVHMGFSRETATTLVHQTLLGSTLYAIESGLHPAILRNSVTSPAGTTASAIYELENGKFRTVIKDAIWSCYRRSLEMGGSDSNVGPGRVAFPRNQMLDGSASHHFIEPPGGEMDATEKATKK